MSKPLNLPDIALLTEHQKSELFNYMNYLIARNNALMGFAYLAFGLSVMVFTSFYVAPSLEGITSGDDFLPVSTAYIMWLITPIA
jgi:hypothetical protein